MLYIIQFEGSNVTAKDDATLYNYLLNGDSGVISGFECRVTSSNNIYDTILNDIECTRNYNYSINL